jgi:hypothetical protein
MFPLPDGNTVNEIMDERSDITSKEREIVTDSGYKVRKDKPNPEADA